MSQQRVSKPALLNETGLDIVQQLQNIAAALGFDLVPTVGEICQNITGSVNNTGHTINSGEYFIANGVKYQATASIPNGGAWANSATPAAGNDLINALNSKITTMELHGIGTIVNITAYNSSSNQYTCPSDGYVRIDSGNEAGDATEISIANKVYQMAICRQTNYVQSISLYIRKGTNVFVDYNVGGRGKAYFCPFD